MSVLLFSLPFLPLLVDLVSIVLVSISTDLVSVAVSVAGCHSQSCHGYLHALPKACGSRLVAHPGFTTHFEGHHPQANLLAKGLTVDGQPILVTESVI